MALAPYADGAHVIRDAIRPGVAGVQKRYTWRELEPRPGEYDFSEIVRDLDVASQAGGQLVVFVCDKSFKNERSTPRYLWEEHTLPVKSVATGTGHVAKRWDPYVVERFGKLMHAMAQRLGTHPNLEGVAIQETALGVEDAVLGANGYTPARYRDALIEQVTTAADAFPQARVFWYANFLPGNQAFLGDVARAVAGRRVAIGGPDVLPDNRALQRLVYPLLRDLQGQAVLFNSVQYESYRHPRGDKSLQDRKGAGAAAGGKSHYYTPLEILEYARDNLQVSYLFWNRVNRAKPPGSFTIQDAYPLMVTHPLDGKSVAR